MPDKDAIRSELEATRAAYHKLLRSLSNDDWPKRSGDPEMSVKELMWHVAWAMGWMAGSVGAVRSGKSTRIPPLLIDPARKLAMRWLARSVTPERAAQKYDEAHATLLTKLDSVSDDDWSREATRFGEVRSVGWYFGHVREHFDEHARDVRTVLAILEPLS
jgi:hypothetical protein